MSNGHEETGHHLEGQLEHEECGAGLKDMMIERCKIMGIRNEGQPEQRGQVKGKAGAPGKGKAGAPGMPPNGERSNARGSTTERCALSLASTGHSVRVGSCARVDGPWGVSQFVSQAFWRYDIPPQRPSRVCPLGIGAGRSVPGVAI